MDMDMPMPEKNNHGFSLLGKRSLVLSHIPMFMAPHQAQVFLEVTLSAADGSDPAKTYLDDQKQTNAKAYVLVSDPLVLPNLAPDAETPLRTFTGKLYRGAWPFDDLAKAPVVIPALTVNVTRAIFYRSFVNAAALKELTYYCFQTPETTYLAHVITRPPDFVQLLSAHVGDLNVKARQGIIELNFTKVPYTIANKLNPKQPMSPVAGNRRVDVQTKAELIYDDDPKHLGEAMSA